MKNHYLQSSLNEVIDTYKKEASQYSQYCPDDLLYAFDQLYQVQLHALESITKILTNID